MGALLAAGSVCAQNLAREHIHTGGRLLTVEAAEPIEVAISPQDATLASSGAQFFTATVTGASNSAVTWEIVGGGSLTPDASPNTVLFQAPQVSAKQTITLRARSVADTSKFAEASIVVTPDTPTGGPTAGDPTATLSASSKAIAVGESVTLLWSTTHALSVTIDQGIGAVGTSGSRQVTPATTTTYTLTATGAEGTTPAEAVVTITVSEPPPTAQLTVSPSTIVQGRESATLTWSTTRALSVSIDNGVGAVTASGSRAVTPTETTTYTLTATGAEGTTPAEARATVTVVEPPPGEPVIKWLEASSFGGGYILYWSVENAERLVLDPDDSDVTGRTFDLVAEPSVETIYTLTAYGGEGTTPATASVTIAPHPSIESFAASAAWSVSGGAVTLSWETSDAVSLSIDNGIGAVTPVAAGSMTVRPTETTTYTLTATGAPRSLTTAAAVTIALLPALTGQLAWMEVRNVKTSAAKPFIFFQTGYDGAIPTDLLWSDASEVGVLQSGSDALAQGTNPADRIFLIEYGRHGAADNTLEVRHLAASGTNAAFWAAGGAGYNKSLYFCRLPEGSDFAGASCIEVPYSTFTAAGHPRTQWDFQSGDSRDAFMESIAGGDTILLVIADSGQTFVSAPAARLSASPATIVRGRSATLSWSTIYAESATIDQGIGAVTPVASGSTTVSPTETTTYTLKAVGAAGTTPATAAVTIIVNEPPTTARLSAAPSRIERRRRSATLSWSTTNAVSVSIDNGVGAVAASGSWAVTPRRTTTYTLTAVGAAGTTPAEASATVRVVKEPPNQPTIRSFTAAKYVLLWLSWSVSDAEELVIDPGDIEVSGDSGFDLIEIPSEETTYTLTASGAKGTTPATASVTVAPDVSIQSFTASPAASVSGGAVTLSWETSNAVSLSIDNGVGAVAPLAAGSVTVRPTATTTYTLTARGAGHSLETAAVTVTVNNPPTAMLTADDTSITRGQSTTLRAASSNARSALIQPGNLSVSLDNSGAGSVSVSPTADTTYTLTVTGPNNVTAADSLTVTVSDLPTAMLTADDTSIARGQSTTLRAASSNARSALIQPGNLSVSLDNSGAGAVSVSPSADTTYTLTVTDSNGVTATDSVTVNVTANTQSVFDAPVGAATGVLWRYSGSSLEVKIDGQLDFISGAADNTALPATLLDDSAARYLTRILVRDSSRRIIVYITAQAGKVGYDGAHDLSAAWERDMRIGLKVGSAQMVFSLLNSSGSVADSSEPYHLQDSQAPTDHNHALLTGPPNLLANFVAAAAAGAAYQVVLLDGSASSPLDWTDPQNPRAPRTPEASATISTLAGTGTAGYSGDGGAATSAQIREPRSVEVDAAGNVYIADHGDHRIRKVDTNGNISTVAGTGAAGFSGDGGAAISAQLNNPDSVAVDASGNLFIADWRNHRIRKVDTNGRISTIAGTGAAGFSGDGGAAISAQLSYPHGVAVDASGNLFIADSNNYRIRKIDTNGRISTIAGTGEIGFSGDGGAAISAQFDYPHSVAVDASGNLFIVDWGNHRIRKVDTNGNISTVAGTGAAGFSGDGGAATSAQLNYPTGVAVDGAGNVYIADRDNHRIRKVDASGDISTVAGTGAAGFSGDGGAAISAQINEPRGVDVDAAGNIYIADWNNHRIRKVEK